MMRHLRLRITLCALALLTTSTAWTQVSWDPYEYAELVEITSEMMREADQIPPERFEERRALLLESLESNHRSLMMLRDALVTGILESYGPEYAEQGSADLLVGYRQYVEILAEVGLCTAANMELQSIRDDVNLLPDNSPEVVTQLEELLESCVEGGAHVASQHEDTQVAERSEGNTEDNTDDETDTAVADQTDNSDATDSSDSSEDTVARGDGSNRDSWRHQQDRDIDDSALLGGEEDNLWAWVLIGSAGALLTGGLIYDLVLADDRDEFDTIQSECDDTGSCDADRLLDLQDTIDGGKVVIGSLLGGAVVAGTVGAILLFTAGEDEPEVSDVVLGPSFHSDGFLFTVGGTF